MRFAQRGPKRTDEEMKQYLKDHGYDSKRVDELKPHEIKEEYESEIARGEKKKGQLVTFYDVAFRVVSPHGGNNANDIKEILSNALDINGMSVSGVIDVKRVSDKQGQLQYTRLRLPIQDLVEKIEPLVHNLSTKENVEALALHKMDELNIPSDQRPGMLQQVLNILRFSSRTRSLRTNAIAPITDWVTCLIKFKRGYDLDEEELDRLISAVATKVHGDVGDMRMYEPLELKYDENKDATIAKIKTTGRIYDTLGLHEAIQSLELLSRPRRGNELAIRVMRKVEPMVADVYSEGGMGGVEDLILDALEDFGVERSRKPALMREVKRLLDL